LFFFTNQFSTKFEFAIFQSHIFIDNQYFFIFNKCPFLEGAQGSRFKFGNNNLTIEQFDNRTI
ncbi:MAG: hypothetical protein M0Q51_15650, partial [Bacteroidales bacterium]|nr:hypothetical protein [Bacteroidales bacterium]